MIPATGDPIESPKRPLWQRRFVRTTLCCAAIIAAGLIAYSDSLHGPFIFDDSGFFGLLGARKHLIRGILAGPRPIADLTFALNYSLGGTAVYGFHLLNLAIHLLAALTLFGVARRTLELPALARRFGEPAAASVAFCIALLWVVHPLLTQSVTYIVQRAESLMGLFFLLTLYCFIRAATSEAATRLNREDAKARSMQEKWTEVPAILPSFGPSRFRGQNSVVIWSVIAVAACALGMGCKQVMIAAPPAVLFYDRCFIAGSFREALRRRWGFYLALAATAFIVTPSILVAFSRHPVTAGFALASVSPLRYARNETGVILHYLRLAFWPSGLCLDYGWPITASILKTVPDAIAVGILLAATLWALIRRPMWGFLGAWFFLILAPTSSFMPLADLAFEQRMYLPLAAVIALAVVAARLLAERLTARLPASQQERRQVRLAAAVALMLPLTFALGWRTWVRNQDYRDPISIWTATMNVSPSNARAWSNLGEMCFNLGYYEEAKAACSKAIQLRPDFSDAYNNLGLAYAGLNAVKEALPFYDEAIRLNPDFAEAYINRGNAYDSLGRSREAIGEYGRAMKLNPDDRLVYVNRAVTYYRLKEYGKALADLEKLKELGGVPPEQLLADIKQAAGQTYSSTSHH